MIGRRLGRYTCLQRLGAGGMAVLYLARRTGAKGFTKAGVRKMIARLHEELAVYEGSEEARQPGDGQPK